MKPSLIRRMVAALGLHSEPEPLGGATAAVWAVGEQVLRIGPRSRMEKELVASVAASRVVRVPSVVDRVDAEDQTGLLMERVRGRAAGDLSDCDEVEARDRGRRCGRVHRALAAVPAPAAMPAAPGVEDLVSSPVLLHLDLHPFNVLLDGDGSPTVIDWANAAAGPAELDLARTAMLMTYDPAARYLSADPRFGALRTGWAEESGWDEIDDPARVWALRFMMSDLAGRHSAVELGPILAKLSELERS